MRSWPVLDDELGRWADAGLRVDLWLRDDDAIEPTPQLECLLRLCRAFELPVLLAIIPAPARRELAERLSGEPLAKPCQHGWRHTNHAPDGEKSAEFGNHRPLEAMLDEIRSGRRRLEMLFPEHVSPVFVPPWNRIAPDLAKRLPDAGFDRISTFRPLIQPGCAGLRVINPDIDIIDWKKGRILRPAAVIEQEIVAHLSMLRSKEIPVSQLGLLLHHLVHGADAWELLTDLVAVFARHTAASFADPTRL